MNRSAQTHGSCLISANKVLYVLLWLLALSTIIGAFVYSLPWASLSLGCFWLLLYLVDSKTAVRAIQPRYLLLGLFFTVVSGFFLGEGDMRLLGLDVSSEGILVGLRMSVRGLCVLSFLAFFLKSGVPSKLKVVAEKIGLGSLSSATAQALSLLPRFREKAGIEGKTLKLSSGGWRRLPRRFGMLARDLIVIAAMTAESLSRRNPGEEPITNLCIPNENTSFANFSFDASKKES